MAKWQVTAGSSGLTQVFHHEGHRDTQRFARLLCSRLRVFSMRASAIPFRFDHRCVGNASFVKADQNNSPPKGFKRPLPCPRPATLLWRAKSLRASFLSRGNRNFDAGCSSTCSGRAGCWLLVENYIKQLLTSAGIKLGSPPFGEPQASRPSSRGASPLAGLTVESGIGSPNAVSTLLESRTRRAVGG
jgi:hypothetical protein